MPVLFVEFVQTLQLMCEVEQNTSFSTSRLGMPEVCVIYSVYCLIEIMHGCKIYYTPMYKVNKRWSIFFCNSKPVLWFLGGGERVTTLTPPPPHLHQTISLLNIIEFNWVIVANGTYKAAWEGMWCIHIFCAKNGTYDIIIFSLQHDTKTVFFCPDISRYPQQSWQVPSKKRLILCIAKWCWSWGWWGR